MTPRLRVLSGREVARILASLGFEVAGVRGSHAKLVRVSPEGERQILTIPLHRDVAPGTLHAVYRQARRFVPDDELRPHFFR